MPIPKKYSEDIKKLIDCLLEKNPNVRPSISEIYELSFVKKMISKFENSEKVMNEFKLKFEMNTKETNCKNFNTLNISNNYPSNGYNSSNSILKSIEDNESPKMSQNIAPQSKNSSNNYYQNYTDLKQKFNTLKVFYKIKIERSIKEKVFTKLRCR